MACVSSRVHALYYIVLHTAAADADVAAVRRTTPQHRIHCIALHCFIVSSAGSRQADSRPTARSGALGVVLCIISRKRHVHTSTYLRYIDQGPERYSQPTFGLVGNSGLSLALAKITFTCTMYFHARREIVRECGLGGCCMREIGH